MKRLFTNKILLLVLIIFGFFLPKLLNDKLPIPSDALVGLYHPWRDNSFNGYNPGKFPVKNPLTTDPVLQTYPWRFVSINYLKQFKLPLWNPYSFSGEPLLGNIQSAAFQLFNLLFIALPFNVAWTSQIILISIFGAFFMYLFLQSFKLSKQSSFFGAIVFPFSGFFISWLTWGNITGTAIWLPFILFCINKYFESEKPVYFLLLILGFTQVLLSGHSQTAFYIFLTTALYLAFLSAACKNLKKIIVICGSALLAAMIASPQIISALEFNSLSNRYIDAAYFPGRPDWFIPPQNLIQLLAPDFFGNPTTNNYWGIWNYAEFTSFIGIIPLFFAISSLYQKNRKTFFFLGLVSFSLLFGVRNPISLLPYSLRIPFISTFQPSRIILLLNFSLITLAAFGIEHFFRKENFKKNTYAFLIISTPIILLILVSKLFPYIFPAIESLNTPDIAFRNLLVPAISTIFVLIILEMKRRHIKATILYSAIIVVTVFELFRSSYKFTPFSPENTIFPKTATTDFLENEKKPFRILATDRRILNPNSFIPYKIESVGGYDPLYLKKYGQLVSAWESNHYSQNPVFNRIITPQNYGSNIASLLNVKYIVTFDEINKQDFGKVMEEGSTKIYLNKNFLERAYFVSKTNKSSSDKEELENIAANVDFKQVAFSQEYEFTGGDESAKVEIKNYQNDSIQLITNSTRSTPLIVSNINYPGWRAYIDGQESKIQEANFILQSIIVPSGEHSVLFKFAPKSFYHSLYLATFGTVLSLTTFLYLWRRKYQ